MKLHTMLGAALCALAATAAQAQNPQLARNLAATCANCHGTDGASTGAMPRLAGQSRTELLQKMRDFKAGQRPATIMHQIAKGYSDEQITLIVDYLSTRN